VGDVINTNDYLAGMVPLVRESPRTFSADPARNRESIRRLWQPCHAAGFFFAKVRKILKYTAT